MARSRNIKPGFFQNETLVEYPFEVRLLFVGLWTLADKKGRMEDRPKRIKMGIFPADDVDVEAGLTTLANGAFIARYTVNGEKFIQIINWGKHQAPHHTEKDSVIPPLEVGEITVNSRKQDGGNPPDSLIHRFTDSLIPDSPIPDSKTNPKSKPLKPASPVSAKKESTADETELQAVCRETWAAYSLEYQSRYKVEPIRNAPVNSQIKGFCSRVPHDEAPHIAAFYVWHNQAFYAQQMHPASLLCKDAEKLRTEWATNTKATTSQARLADQTQGMGQIWEKLKREITQNERTVDQNS